MQRVVDLGKGVAGIEAAGAVELKGVAVPGVGSRFGHDVDHAAGVQSVAGRKRVGFNVELLQGLREGKGQVHIGKCIVIVPAVEQVVDAVALGPGDGDGGRAVKVLAAGQVSGRGYGCRSSRQQDKLRGQASIERNVADALRIDHVGNGVRLGLQQGAAGGDLDRLRDGAHLQRGVEGNVIIHLQHDARLDVGLEAGLGNFEPVRTDG